MFTASTCPGPKIGLSSGGSEARPETGAPTNRRKWLRRLAVVSLGALAAFGFVWWDRRGPQAPIEIFDGITYGCELLPATEEGSGLLHWVRIDLTASGIELYVTPLDASAVAQGWQYRLRRIKNIVNKEHLAIAINAAMFTSNAGWRPQMPGDLANGVETVVADHVVSHLWEHTYLLWFDDHLTPQLRPSKPPAAAELGKAKWGIGGQGVGLQNGKVGGVSSSPDARTAVAVDRERKLLFLAVGEYISPRLMLQKLADLGAKDGMLLDGGGSSSIALGKDAAGVPAGVLYGGWRPVATCFGVKAKPLRAPK
jgi:Phosphodiester glycosidase